MAKDAIELVLHSRQERGESIPEQDGTFLRSVDVTYAA
jgi:predicted RNase H-like HicB family nuclease